MSRQYEDVQLPGLVVTPRGSYADYTGEETFAPTFQEYMDAKAMGARVGAANHIVHQYWPNVPTIPRQKYGNLDAIDSKFAGLMGMSDKDRIMWFGREPNPETCLYTATSQYGDKGAIASGNITFATNPERYGFKRVPYDSNEI